MSTFRERFMSGETDFEEIFDLTDEWNISDETCTLREYLGLNAEEEDIWISESDEALEEYMNKEKNRWIFFTDLDGTLLNDEKKISAETGKKLDQLLQEGHIITISTGRAYASAYRQAKLLGLDRNGCYIICYNGGQIYEAKTGKQLRSEAIPHALAELCVAEAKKMNLHIQAYSRTEVIAETTCPLMEKYSAVQKLPCKVVKDMFKELKEETPKLLVLEDDISKINELRKRLDKVTGGQVNHFMSQVNYLEIVPAGVNKGNAVRFLSDYLSVPIERTVAAGDAENDLTMIEAAGIGAVMCNGEDKLKKAADYVTTLDNNHDGAAEIIDRFILKS